CTSFAWIVLGSTLMYRSSMPAEDLRSKVANTWGAAHEQKAPVAVFSERVLRTEKTNENGKEVDRLVETSVDRRIPLEASRITADIHLEHRQKGLLWFSTYQVRFDGAYTFRNATDQERLISFTFPYPAAKATYDGLVFTIDGQSVANMETTGSVRGSKSVPPG